MQKRTYLHPEMYGMTGGGRRTMKPSRAGKSRQDRVLNGVKGEDGKWYTHSGQEITGWIGGTMPVVSTDED